jgi:hypothetical protein
MVKILRQLLGLLLITLAWTDPFELGLEFQVFFFILGFDLTHLFVKVGVFVLDLFLGISGLGWYLLIFLGIEALFYFLKLNKILGYIIKPVVVFGIIMLSGFGWQLGLIVAGIDLLLSLRK